MIRLTIRILFTGMLLTTNVSGSAEAQQANYATAAKDVAERLMSGTLRSSATAVSEAHAYAGIASFDGARETRAAVAPVIPLRLRAIESLALARDLRGSARGEYRITLGELGKQMGQIDWGEMASADDGQALLLVLRELVSAATSEPSSPHSFVPLLLRDLALKRGLDLSDPELRAQDVTLSLFEIRLFLSQWIRGDESRPLAVLNLPEDAAHRGPSAFSLSALATFTPTPCGDFLDTYEGEEGKPLAGWLGDWSTSKMLDEAIAKASAAAGLGASAAETLAKGIAGATLVIKMLKIIASTMDASVTFKLQEPLPKDTAYYGKGKDDIYTFAALIELEPDSYDWNDDRAAVDCVTALGFTMPDSRDMMLKALEQWVVKWDATALAGHATWNARINPLLYRQGIPETKIVTANSKFSLAGNPAITARAKFAMSGKPAGASTFVVQMKEDPAYANRATTFVRNEGAINMRAELNQQQAPDYSLLIKAVAAGLTGALAAPLSIAGLALDALADGLWKSFSPRKATVRIPVAWYDEATWKGQITVTTTYGQRQDTTTSETEPAMRAGGPPVRRTSHTLVELKREETWTFKWHGRDDVEVVANLNGSMRNLMETRLSGIFCARENVDSYPANRVEKLDVSSRSLGKGSSKEGTVTLDIDEANRTYTVSYGYSGGPIPVVVTGSSTRQLTDPCYNENESTPINGEDTMASPPGAGELEGRYNPGQTTISGSKTLQTEAGTTRIQWSFTRK